MYGDNMILPAGLLSETRFGDTKFFVQTEFAARPQPRVTTTITIDGAVVEKVENVWDKLPQTEEEKEAVESCLREQHQRVLKTIREKKGKLISFEPGQVEDNPHEDESIVKLKVELSKIKGVKGWVFLLSGSRMTMYLLSEPEDRRGEDFMWQMKELSFFLPQVTELGNFKGGILTSAQSRMLFLPFHRHMLGLKLEPQVDCEKLVRRIKSLL
jgi:hypothetical protein